MDVRQLCGGSAQCWIGLRRDVRGGPSNFVWVDGAPVEYTNWEAWEPWNVLSRDGAAAIGPSAEGGWLPVRLLLGLILVAHLALTALLCSFCYRDGVALPSPEQLQPQEQLQQQQQQHSGDGRVGCYCLGAVGSLATVFADPSPFRLLGVMLDCNGAAFLRLHAARLVLP